MNKIIIIFIIISIYLNNYLNNAQSIIQLPDDQMIAAKDLYFQIYNKNTTNPCSDKTMFTCKLINDGNSTNSALYTITQLGLIKNNNTLPIINANFTSFKNATFLKVDNGIILKNSLFSSLPEFYNKASIYIVNESIEIPNDIILPINLNQITFGDISVPIPVNLFSGSVEVFNILKVSNGFNLPSVFPSTMSVNYSLKRFSTYLNYDSVFPSNAGSVLLNLTSLRLSFYNDITEPGYKYYSLPIFEKFSKLSTLSITFEQQQQQQQQQVSSELSNAQLWNFEQSITNLTTLDDLHIIGKGFILDKSIGFTDFSNFKPSFFLYFKDNASDLINQCISKPCLKLPQNSSISIINCNLTQINLDFTNLIYFKISSNLNEIELPNDSSIQFLTTKFEFSHNSFIGSIPESYCKFSKSRYPVLSYNQLTSLPTCFTCLGSNYTTTKNLLPNNFGNQFNESSLPTTCSTFSFNNNYNHIVKTDGSSIITINGNDFGYDSNNENIKITIPNNEINILIPKGQGKDINLISNFGYDFKLKYTFNYSYEIPVIKSYEFNNHTNSINIYGTGFSFINNNNISINNIIYNASISNENGLIYITDLNDPFKSMSIGEKYIVSVIVGGQESNSIIIINEPNNSSSSSHDNGSSSTNSSSILKITYNILLISFFLNFIFLKL